MVLLIRNGYQIGEWLFDCGDRKSWTTLSDVVTTHQIYSLQRQMKGYSVDEKQKELILRPSRVSKIFITHLHGDHILGLPSFLSDAGVSRTQANSSVPIDIYGPPGLAKFLKTVFMLTDSKLNHPCVVHELYDNENDPRLEELTDKLQYSDKRIQVNPVFPKKDGFWSLVSVRFSNQIHEIGSFR